MAETQHITRRGFILLYRASHRACMFLFERSNFAARGSARPIMRFDQVANQIQVILGQFPNPGIIRDGRRYLMDDQNQSFGYPLGSYPVSYL